MKRKLKQGLIAIAITLMMVMLLTPAQAQTINITFEKTGVIATGTARSENSQGYAMWWGAGHNWDYIKVNGEIAFCIEPEIQLKPESSYTESSFSHADRETFSRIIYHGYDSNPTAENYTLTQLTLWEYIASIRSDLTVTNFKNLGVPQYEAKRDALMAKVSKHSITASFAGSTISLNVGETLKITDNNGVLANSAITDKGGLETSINGNSLSVKALTSSPLTSKITLKKYSDITGNASVSPILYASTDSQNVIAKGNPNPVIYTVNVTINDKGNLEIVKLNEAGQPIPNTVFTLSKNSDMSQPIGTYTTGTNGKVTVSNIVFGSYYVQEKQVPSPLLLDSTIKKIEITAGQTASFSHTNKAAQGQIVVTKSSNEGLLENTVFEIRNSINVLVETIKTNSDGRAQSSLLPLGKYTLKEVTASPGYVLDDTVYEVELKYKDQLTPLVTQSFSLSNKLIEGRIRVVKTDGVTSLPVEGVVFNVLSLPEREPIETIVSDSDGLAISSSLPYGEYVIVEEDSPVEYYLNENEYVVAIKENGKTEEVTIANDPVLMKLQLIKSDQEDETKVLPGVVFEVLNDQEEVMFTLTTDELGQALSQESLPYGTYRLREVKAAPGYVLGDDVYFEINRDTEFIEIEEVRVLSLNLNNNQTTTTVSKVDIHGEPLAGAHLRIIDGDGHTVSEWVSTDVPHVIRGLNTNEQYLLIEDSAPEGYLLSDPVTMFIQETLEIQAFEMVNRYIPGIVTHASVQTRDKENPNLVTIIDKVSYDRLVEGEAYTLQGYLMDKASGESLLNNGQPIVSEVDFIAKETSGEVEMSYVLDSTYVKVGTVVVFTELLQDGKLLVSHQDIDDEKQSVNFYEVVVKKVDAMSGKPLKDAEFTLYQGDVLIDRSMSDINGEIHYVLEEGVFELIESLAPRGYIKDESIRQINSVRDSYLEVENTLMDFPPLPSTGQGEEGVLLLIGAIVLIGTGLYLMRKEK